LRGKRINARAYHAGMNARERSETQELFIKDEVDIIVATIAFGMGIDKPDVRLVVHYTYPKTLENYYQEIGRAGRDGLPSDCVMFYTYADTRKHEFFINQIVDDDSRRRAQEKLNEVIHYAQLMSCRKKYLLGYFGEELAGTNCDGCDVCVPLASLGTSPATTSSETGALLPKKPKIKTEPVLDFKRKKGDLEFNQDLFEELRVLRKELADKDDVPSFVIFGNVSLQEMAYYLPRTPEDFSRITGVGAAKQKKFGKLFLTTITRFTKENNISSINIPNKKR
jgi:ATP-dependent DNA helicase RecQ